jgi:flagellar basal body-associated protein FliL
MAETRRAEEAVAEKRLENGQNRNLLPWLLICLLLLALAVTAGFFWLGGKLPFARGEQNAAPEEPRYVLPMKEFQVNLADPGSKRFLRTQIYLAFNDRPLQKEIAAREAELRSEIIAVLREYTVEELAGSRGMETMRRDIVGRLNKILHDGRIETIYFSELLIQ